MAVFFSFHYEQDAWRVQQVLNMGALEGQTILNAQDWEEVKRKGDQAIKDWIGKQMAYKSAVVVLIGAQTATRPWVKYEISQAWNEKKPLVGVRIHGLANKSGQTDAAGANPFDSVPLQGGGNVGNYVPVHSPLGANSQQVYGSISTNLKAWVDGAYKRS